MALDSVKILYKGGTAEIEVKKSRFIANLKSVESEEEAAAFIVENNLSRLLCELLQLFHVVAVECHKKVSADVNTLDLLREYALSKVALGSENDLFLHEFQCLRLEVVHEEFRNRRNTVFQVLIRDDQADGLFRCRDEL